VVEEVGPHLERGHDLMRFDPLVGEPDLRVERALERDDR
jgi:hypothetical protein